MQANYHTHTPRCNHAEGSEREYIERALVGGFKTLGFSDHTAYFFHGTDYWSHIRMEPEELPEYCGTIRTLAAEYKDRIDIRLGVEAEFYPRFFDKTVEKLRLNGVEYMILGQHFIENEMDAPYCGRATEDEKILDAYVAQSIEAMETGLFTYFAHPDLIYFTGSREQFAKQVRRLCRAANRCKLPMEINLLGIRSFRHYPNPDFWKIAAEEGVTAILGSDAHRPKDVWDPESERMALAWAKELNLTVIETAELKKL